MAAPVATITDLMNDDASWKAILLKFGLEDVAVTKFTDDYSTIRDLIVSNPTQIKYVISQ